MKDLKVYSVLCFVFTLMLGLFVACSAAGPQLISGERTVGGCDKCSGAKDVNCGNKDSTSDCDTFRSKCTGTGTLDCEKASGPGSAPCSSDRANCKQVKSRTCN